MEITYFSLSLMSLVFFTARETFLDNTQRDTVRLCPYISLFCSQPQERESTLNIIMFYYEHRKNLFILVCVVEIKV